MTENTQKWILEFAAEAQKKVDAVNEAMRPHLANIAAMEEVAKRASETIRIAMEPYERNAKLIKDHYDKMQEVVNTIGPVFNVQKNWISAVHELNIEQPVEKKKPTIVVQLIRHGDSKIIFELKANDMGKKNSHHLLLLKALLFNTDENGFISYEDIEAFFTKNGVQPKPNKRARRKTIWNACDNICRFLGIPSEYHGKELISKVKGKGLTIYNPKIEI